jgi:hypothetical protein
MISRDRSIEDGNERAVFGVAKASLAEVSSSTIIIRRYYYPRRCSSEEDGK